MTLEQMQKTLNATIERMARQGMNYEAEIANLTAQIIVLQDELAELKPAEDATPAKAAASKA